jgi:membrane fusion protein
MQNQLFREQAVEHQKDGLHGEVLILPSMSHTWMTVIVLLWICALFTWLFTSSYARQETVTGWLEPPTGIVRVYSDNSTGKIKQVLVKEGQKVSKGQPLVIINGDRVLANGDNLETLLLDEYQQQQQLLDKQLLRNAVIYDVRLKDINQQINASEQDLDRLDEQIATVNQRHSILKARVKNSLLMNEKGHISDIEYETKVEQELAVRSELQSLLRSQVNQQNRIAQLKTQLEIMPQEHQDSLAQVKSSLSDIAQRIAQLHGQRAHIVKASRDGIVTNLQIKQGQQATTTNPLMSLVPDNADIEARLLIPVRAAGFVKVGQDIDIRYDAFPYQKFGLYSGQVRSISSSILLPNEINSLQLQINEPVYLVRAELTQKAVTAYGLDMALKSGMTFSADIKLADRTLIEWLLEPIFSLKGRI